MNPETSSWVNVSEMLRAINPREPVYCIYPHVYLQTARSFVNGFPGRVLYAVKANDDPSIIRLLNQGGVEHFDCASVPEVELVRKNCPGATCYFMIPAALRGAVREAFHDFDVRHFMVDHTSSLDALAAEIQIDQTVVFARMAVSHESAMMDLSSKFAAP
jgi:ornithine decarboxylase